MSFFVRDALFKKICDLIVDSASGENVVFLGLVKTMNLSTLKHYNPYKVGWIKKGVEVSN